MTRRTTLQLLLLTVLVAPTNVPVLAHEGHDHTILGTVTMAATDHVMVKDKDGKDHTVYLKTDTKVVRQKQALKVADIKVDTRVAITAVTEKAAGKERMVAKSIELGVATK